jgi:alpha/beta superfamily hydrolase
MNIMVVTLDFSGCGLSEGEYISLGYFEKEDVNVLVNHLRELDVTTRIALWGRSMGAVIAIQSAQADPSLACIVADSPFSTLNTLANELVSHFDVNIPGLMIKLVFKMVRSSVKKRAKFDIKCVIRFHAICWCRWFVRSFHEPSKFANRLAPF